MILDRLTPLNAITDVFEPLYRDDSVYIAKWKITRSKLDIKLRFPKVNDTSEYSGDWFITRKNALKYRKIYDNNGMKCLKIPFSEFQRLEVTERSRHEL